jgi:hypothetical protein
MSTFEMVLFISWNMEGSVDNIPVSTKVNIISIYAPRNFDIDANINTRKRVEATAGMVVVSSPLFLKSIAFRTSNSRSVLSTPHFLRTKPNCLRLHR